MEWFILWVVCGFFAAAIASGKGRSFGGWFALGFLFGPLALIASGFMEKLEPEKNVTVKHIAEPAERKCPFCAEMIKGEAIVCKHCGRDVDPVPVSKSLCPHCGHDAGDDPAQCTYCGRDPREKPDAPGALHCPHCGKVVGTNPSRCQYCERDTGY